MDDFKSLLDRHVGNKFQIDEKWFELPLSEIETPNSRRCTPSYRSLPENFPNLMCSGRTPFDAGFLNDQWISVPVGSEDFNFKNMTKNPHEFALFACEDERFEVDMVHDSTVDAVVAALVPCTVRFQWQPSSLTYLVVVIVVVVVVVLFQFRAYSAIFAQT